MKRQIVQVAVVLGVMTLVGDACAQENWPQWRGASQNGVSEATKLPKTWSLTENIAWKTPLPSWSGGSPVIWVVLGAGANGTRDRERIAAPG